MSKPMNAITGIIAMGQIPLLEHRSFGDAPPRWIVWLAYNKDRTSGTYLILSNDGAIWKETTYPDGSVSCHIVKESSFRRQKGHISPTGDAN